MNDAPETHDCEHEGCTSLGAEEYQWPGEVDGKTSIWLCSEHAVETGFCLWCGHFGSGSEEYDFSPAKGYHRDCWDEFRYEAGEIDDEDDYDEY